MARWDPDAPERLKTAALELFVERGFEATTVPEIARRAGLTTRTFFRHFADKREVMFGYEDSIPARVASVMESAAPEEQPLDLLARGLRGLAPTFECMPDELRIMRRVIDSDSGLQERELRKFSLIAAEVERGFRARGIPELEARLLAEISATVVRVGVQRWVEHPERDLGDVFVETLTAFGAVTASVR